MARNSSYTSTQTRSHTPTHEVGKPSREIFFIFFGKQEESKAGDEHLLAILRKRQKRLKSGLGWLAGIGAQHCFTDQADIKPP